MQIRFRVFDSDSTVRADAGLSENNWIYLGQNILEYPSAAEDGKFFAIPALLSVIVFLK